MYSQSSHGASGGAPTARDKRPPWETGPISVLSKQKEREFKALVIASRGAYAHPVRVLDAHSGPHEGVADGLVHLHSAE